MPGVGGGFSLPRHPCVLLRFLGSVSTAYHTHFLQRFLFRFLVNLYFIASLSPPRVLSLSFLSPQKIAALLCSNHGAMALDATEVGASVDASFMLFSAYLVFFMQAGFAMVRHRTRVPPEPVL